MKKHILKKEKALFGKATEVFWINLFLLEKGLASRGDAYIYRKA